MTGIRRYRTQLRLAIRIAVAAMLAFALSRALDLTQGYPAVITSVIVMQGSLGASLKAMFDRLVGSLGGAVWGVAMLLAFGHEGTAGLATVAATIGPLALLVALKPAYRPAPITAIILLFAPTSEAIPLLPAIHRMMGIGLGSAVALVVALTVLPERARGSLLETASAALAQMSQLVTILMKTPASIAEREEDARPFHDRVRALLVQAEAAAEAASRERVAHLTSGPDPQPLCRTVRRIYHDLAMIGRATAEHLPSQLEAELSEATSAVSEAIALFLEQIGTALSEAQPAPSLEGVESALVRREATIANLRKAGRTRELTSESVGRMFGLGFALEQLHRNLLDLIDRTNDATSGL